MMSSDNVNSCNNSPAPIQREQNEEIALESLGLLGRLPPELRNRIYESYHNFPPIIIDSEETEVALRINWHGKPVIPALTATCRLLYQETIGYTSTVLQQEGIILAQIQLRSFKNLEPLLGNLNETLHGLSKKHQRPFNELKSRVWVVETFRHRNKRQGSWKGKSELDSTANSSWRDWYQPHPLMGVWEGYHALSSMGTFEI